MFYWTPVSLPSPPPPRCPCLGACGVRLLSEFQSAQATLLFIGGGRDGGGGGLAGATGCVCQSHIQRDRRSAHRWLVGAVSGGHEALTAARGANPALHSSHVAVSPFIIRLMRRTQAAQSISARAFSFYRPPPSSSSSGQPLPPFHLSTVRLM